MLDLSGWKSFLGVIARVEPNEQEAPQAAAAQSPPDKQELKREVLDFLKLVVWFLIIFLGLRQYVIEGYEVQGESMEPTLSNNQRILVFKLPHELSKLSLFRGLNAIEPGDIIVFESPDNLTKRYVKRVIAMGSKKQSGQTVGAQGPEDAGDPVPQVLVTYERGVVYVNNKKIEEPYIAPGARRSDEHQELLLSPGEYYVLGDNRNVSKDSRSFNAIADETLIGKAVIRFWPPSEISLLR